MKKQQQLMTLTLPIYPQILVMVFVLFHVHIFIAMGKLIHLFYMHDSKSHIKHG